MDDDDPEFLAEVARATAASLDPANMIGVPAEVAVPIIRPVFAHLQLELKTLRSIKELFQRLTNLVGQKACGICTSLNHSLDHYCSMCESPLPGFLELLNPKYRAELQMFVSNGSHFSLFEFEDGFKRIGQSFLNRDARVQEEANHAVSIEFKFDDLTVPPAIPPPSLPSSPRGPRAVGLVRTITMGQAPTAETAVVFSLSPANVAKRDVKFEALRALGSTESQANFLARVETFGMNFIATNSLCQKLANEYIFERISHGTDELRKLDKIKDAATVAELENQIPSYQARVEALCGQAAQAAAGVSELESWLAGHCSPRTISGEVSPPSPPPSPLLDLFGESARSAGEKASLVSKFLGRAAAAVAEAATIVAPLQHAVEQARTPPASPRLPPTPTIEGCIEPTAAPDGTTEAVIAPVAEPAVESGPVTVEATVAPVALASAEPEAVEVTMETVEEYVQYRTVLDSAAAEIWQQYQRVVDEIDKIESAAFELEDLVRAPMARIVSSILIGNNHPDPNLVMEQMPPFEPWPLSIWNVQSSESAGVKERERKDLEEAAKEKDMDSGEKGGKEGDSDLEGKKEMQEKSQEKSHEQPAEKKPAKKPFKPHVTERWTLSFWDLEPKEIRGRMNFRLIDYGQSFEPFLSERFLGCDPDGLPFPDAAASCTRELQRCFYLSLGMALGMHPFHLQEGFKSEVRTKIAEMTEGFALRPGCDSGGHLGEMRQVLREAQPISVEILGKVWPRFLTGVQVVCLKFGDEDRLSGLRPFNGVHVFRNPDGSTEGPPAPPPAPTGRPLRTVYLRHCPGHYTHLVPHLTAGRDFYLDLKECFRRVNEAHDRRSSYIIPRIPWYESPVIEPAAGAAQIEVAAVDPATASATVSRSRSGSGLVDTESDTGSEAESA